MATPIDLLVSTEWLGARLDDPEVRVVDMRGYVVTRPLEPGVEHADYRVRWGNTWLRTSRVRSISTGPATLSISTTQYRRRSRPRSDSPRPWRSAGSATRPMWSRWTTRAVNLRPGSGGAQLLWSRRGQRASGRLEPLGRGGKPRRVRSCQSSPRRFHAAGPPGAPADR